ncbi:MAG: hypothetical protein M3065_15585 [Actinomycetota bacterium]|nr:hypothetical protein [Actinomycetota bacterium]
MVAYPAAGSRVGQDAVPADASPDDVWQIAALRLIKGEGRAAVGGEAQLKAPGRPEIALTSGLPAVRMVRR